MNRFYGAVLLALSCSLILAALLYTFDLILILRIGLGTLSAGIKAVMIVLCLILSLVAFKAGRRRFFIPNRTNKITEKTEGADEPETPITSAISAEAPPSQYLSYKRARTPTGIAIFAVISILVTFSLYGFYKLQWDANNSQIELG